MQIGTSMDVVVLDWLKIKILQENSRYKYS